MKLFAIALVVAASSTAVAEPDACKPTGDTMIEIAQLVDNEPTANVTTLYGTGAWTTAETKPDGKPGAHGDGCLPKDKLAKVRDDLHAMTWTIRHNRVHCMMVSPKHTVYKIAGKTMFTAKVCSQDVLDDKNQALLDDITAKLADLK